MRFGRSANSEKSSWMPTRLSKFSRTSAPCASHGLAKADCSDHSVSKGPITCHITEPGMAASDPRRLKDLESEIGKLKNLLAETMLVRPERASGKKLLKPASRRTVMVLCRDYQFSTRRACGHWVLHTEEGRIAMRGYGNGWSRFIKQLWVACCMPSLAGWWSDFTERSARTLRRRNENPQVACAEGAWCPSRAKAVEPGVTMDISPTAGSSAGPVHTGMSGD